MGIARGPANVVNPPEYAKFNTILQNLQNHSELAQTTWQASYTHAMLHLYQKSSNLEILG